MSTPTITKYILEVRPLGVSPFRRVLIFNPVAGRYESFYLGRGKWFTAHRRNDDRPVFGGGIKGATRINDKTWVEKQAKAFKRKGFATRVTAVKLRKYKHLTGDLDARPELLDALDKLGAKLGHEINIVSGARTLDEQKFLYHLYQIGKGNLAAYPNANAPHIRGIASDAYINGVPLAKVKGARALASKLGVHFPVTGEPWHAELINP